MADNLTAHNFTKYKTPNTDKMKHTIEQQEDIRSEVIVKIEEDIKNDHYIDIYELLSFVPIQNLVNFLPNDIANKFE